MDSSVPPALFLDNFKQAVNLRGASWLLRCMNTYANTIAMVRRSKTDELFLIRIVAKPCPENSEASETGGAYVNCWVDADDLRIAEQKAIEAIEGERWQPVKFDNWKLVCRRCYIEDANLEVAERCEYLERVDEAFDYGFALVFNCWPIDAPDADAEPEP